MSDLDVIKEIEKKLNCTFKEINIKEIMAFWGKNCYSIDKQGNIIAFSIIGMDVKKLPEIFSNLIHIAYLMLAGMNLTDISPLKNLKRISRLYLHHNQISDISPLKNLKKIKKLYY